MKSVIFSLVVTLTILLACCSGPSFGADSNEWLRAQTETNGVVLQASVTQGNVTWKDMSMFLEISNSTPRKVIYYTGPSPLGGFTFLVVDGKGQNVPLTDHGKRLMESAKNMVTLYSSDELLPNTTISLPIKLSDVLVITNAGTYKLDATWESNPLHPTRSLKIELKNVPFAVSKF